MHSGIEHELASIHQTGVVICDSSTNAETLRINDIIGLNIEKDNLTPAQALLKQFHEMTAWRTTKVETTFTIKPKYQMEVMSAYLIDRVHFLHSYDSLFLQMCDIMTFIVQRTLVHDYLFVLDRERLDPEKLPITIDGWAMMKKQIYPWFYGEKSLDVMFCDTAFSGHGIILLDFTQMEEIFTKMKEQYKQIQPTAE